MNILVVEDNIELNRAICNTISKCRIMTNVDSATNGEDGLYMAMNNEYDIIVLDLMLPRMNGLEVLSKLRKVKDCGIIVLTALTDKETTINALKIGADDYMTKPFDNDELVARMISIFRRHSKTIVKNSYTFGTLSVDYDSTTVTVDKDVLVLTGKVYEIFEYLIRHKNTIITKDRLFTRVWGFDSDTIYTVTEVYVSKLRKLLEKHGLKKNLVTIKNIGYMWDESIKE